METQNWFNPESVQPLQTSLENVLLFFLILFLCIFACVMFPYFVKRVYQNKNEEKVRSRKLSDFCGSAVLHDKSQLPDQNLQNLRFCDIANPLYSHFRHIYRAICLIYASFGISILVILIIAGTNLTNGLLITSISSNMLIIWGGCVAIIILIVQVHQFTISLVAISKFVSVFTSDYQKSIEKALTIIRCFLYPIVLTADSYIGSTFETNGELQCWIVYLIEKGATGEFKEKYC
ncbi:hypothetical protein CAEBREN_02523 [Caenorhabditis brenneri]|uniref:Uncharacterized protein n=1 Tax=Caenorhabditis brenneri TaxID=135651 RepID=G0NJF4_CAEBE|nr:hypothetical protein CAEBREN_02523 [Caenorhabditis brenneri]